MMKKIMLIMLGFFMVHLTYAQTVSISGKVTNEMGETLPGVSIQISGTTSGTITKFDGTFLLEAPADAILIFSYIGYQEMEVPVNGRTSLDITMAETSISVDEVVVTALGITQAKKSVGYAIQQVDAESLEKAKSSNIANMLTGRVAGLNVANPTGIFQGAEMNLRGKQPLIIIDNLPVSSQMWEINPDDIAQINVLKGTTASALYGSRGRNGAILITTKNAQQTGLQVQISTNTMVSAGYCSFPEIQEEYGNGSQGLYEFWDGADGGVSDGDMVWGPKFEDGVMIAQWNSPIYDNVTGETIEWYGDVSGTKYDDKSRYSRVSIPWEYNNALDEFLETGFITKNNISISYRGEKVSHRLSANYSYQKGQVPNSKLQSGGVKLNSTYQLTNNLTLETKFGYDKIYSPNYPRYGYGPKNHIYTILVWMGWDVNMQDLKNHLWVPGQEGYRQANWNYAWYNNPYFAAYKLNQEYNEDILTGNINLKWDITKDLSIVGRTSAIRQDRFEDRESPKSYLNYDDAREGDYKTWNRNWLTMDNDIHLSYNKLLTPGLNLTINAGATNFIHQYNHYYAATDGLVVPEVYSLNNTQNPVVAETYEQTKTIRSLYGTVNFDIIDAFFLNFALRNDWSSALPAENDSYFYPSVSLSTMVSNLIDMPDAVDYLKIYGSWAEVSADLAPAQDGNPTRTESEWDISDYAGYKSPYQISSYYSNIGTYNGLTMLSYPGTIINPDIKPEKSTSYEVGLSSSFFNNRFGLGFTYFNVVDENQIIELPLTSSTGFDNRLVNGNEYTTNGIEFEISAVPVKSDKFEWNLSANIAHMVTRITGIYGGEEKYGNYSLDERTDNLYGTGWLKAPDGQLILDIETGMPSRDPYPQLFGHESPDVWYGFQNSFRMGRFTLNMDFDGVIGGVINSKTVAKMWWAGKTIESTEYRDQQYATSDPVYLAEGVNVVSGDLVRDANGNIISDTRVFQQNATKVDWQTWCQNYPYRALVNDDESEKFANVLDRTFLKLRRVALTYNMTPVVDGFMGIKRMDATLFCYNAFMLKKAKVIDPDFGRDDELQDPDTRYIGLNLTFNF